jgi:hypothetical protein
MAEAPATSKPKTQLRAKKRNILDSNAPEVVAIIAGGDRPSDIARLYGVAPSSITRFTERHADAIDAMRTEIVRQVEDYAIAHKVNRVATLQRLMDDVTAHLDARGLMEVSTVTKPDGTTIERERFAREVSAELRAILKDAALEMGQIPSGNGGGIEIKDSQVIITRNTPELGV